MERPLGIDLFAGAGGMSLGFEQAGFDVVAAVELDPVHAAIHAYNFPHCATLPRSVADVSGAEVRRIAKIGNRQIDVLFGGAPCQGFSLIGQRALDDPRNGLVRHFVRLVLELRPRCFVFENVKGLTVGRHRAFLDELVEAFDAGGYKVRLPWKVLNAASYAVPQDRERLILLGARRGTKLPEYPAATTRAPRGDEGQSNLKKGPTVEMALGDLPNAEDHPELEHSDAVKITRWRRPQSDYAKELRGLTNSCWHYGYVRDWSPGLLTSSLRTEHTEISKRRFARTPEGEVEPISRFLKLPRGGLSNTLRAGTDASRGAFTSPRPIHYQYPRCITVREMARLHGFPDWFRFHSTKWHGARQVGNAVPPPLARAVASEVIRALGYKPTRPSKTLRLGDAALLSMDMAEAARHWNVTCPIGKRNMKSGATKRRQEDIERQLELSGL
jgi:DNA (cytosine-5)-methyltransferase 1